MLYELLKHKLSYTLLAMILFINVGYFFLVWPQSAAMRIGAVSMSASYFFWGVFSHVKSNRITKAVVREYFFAALLAGGMLYLLTI